MADKLRDRIRRALEDDAPVPNADADALAAREGLSRAEARERLRVQRRGRAAARVRAQGVQEAAATALRQAGEGLAAVVQTRYGRVQVAGVSVEQVGEEAAVSVLLAGAPPGSDPHFRIFNPPTLVEDPGGDVEVRGRRYREDPLGAVAEVIARHQQEARR